MNSSKLWINFLAIFTNENAGNVKWNHKKKYHIIKKNHPKIPKHNNNKT